MRTIRTHAVKVRHSLSTKNEQKQRDYERAFVTCQQTQENTPVIFSHMGKGPNCYCLPKMPSFLQARLQESRARVGCLPVGLPESKTSGGRGVGGEGGAGESAGVQGAGDAAVGTLLPRLTSRGARLEVDGAPRLKPTVPPTSANVLRILQGPCRPPRAANRPPPPLKCAQGLGACTCSQLLPPEGIFKRLPVTGDLSPLTGIKLITQ